MPQYQQITRGKAKVGGLVIGPTGGLIKTLKTATVSINPASIAATTRGATTFTVTGAAVGDLLIMQPPATLNDDLVFAGCAITAADTGTVYLYNTTAGAIDDVALSWVYTWVDLT